MKKINVNSLNSHLCVSEMLPKTCCKLPAVTLLTDGLRKTGAFYMLVTV